MGKELGTNNSIKLYLHILKSVCNRKIYNSTMETDRFWQISQTQLL